MTDKQIIIEDYFNIMRDDYGRIYCIQEIGDTKQLIKAIREQNEYIQHKEQECERLKKQLMQKSEVDMFFNTPIEGWSNDPCGICPHKAENEELKKTIDDLLHKPEIQDKILWKIDNEALLGSKDAWIYKLEQTLQEIKEIVEKYQKEYLVNNGVNLLCNQILNKISEVIPDEKS
jgi:hypothetical protein